MKLATYNDGSRDGQLVVVSRDLAQAHFAAGIATRLQQVLDDWNFLSPQLQDLFVTLNQGKTRHAFAFEPRQCMAPLPRAFQHVHAAQGLQQCASDALLGPRQDAWFGAASWQIDFGAALAAITGDVAQGASAEQGLDGVRLLMLANQWQLHAPPGDGGSALHRLPGAAFGPVAVTPDELGAAWQSGRVQGSLQSSVNGRRLGLNDSGAQMPLHFGALIAALSATRPLRAGSIVSASPLGGADAAKGFASLAERRAAEAATAGAGAAQGEAPTPWLAFGDLVRVAWTGHGGQAVLGSIEQRVAGPQTAGIATPVADHAGDADDAHLAGQIDQSDLADGASR